MAFLEFVDIDKSFGNNIDFRRVKLFIAYQGIYMSKSYLQDIWKLYFNKNIKLH